MKPSLALGPEPDFSHSPSQRAVRSQSHRGLRSLQATLQHIQYSAEVQYLRGPQWVGASAQVCYLSSGCPNPRENLTCLEESVYYKHALQVVPHESDFL